MQTVGRAILPMHSDCGASLSESAEVPCTDDVASLSYCSLISYEVDDQSTQLPLFLAG